MDLSKHDSEDGQSPVDVSRSERMKQLESTLGIDLQEFSKPYEKDGSKIKRIKVNCPFTMTRLPVTAVKIPEKEVTRIENVVIGNTSGIIPLEPVEAKREDEKDIPNPTDTSSPIPDLQSKKESFPSLHAINKQTADKQASKEDGGNIETDEATKEEGLGNGKPASTLDEASNAMISVAKEEERSRTSKDQQPSMEIESGERTVLQKWQKILEIATSEEEGHSLSLEMVIDSNENPWIWIRRNNVEIPVENELNYITFYPVEFATILHRTNMLSNFDQEITQNFNNREIKVYRPTVIPSTMNMYAFQSPDGTFLVPQVILEMWKENVKNLEILQGIVQPRMTARAKRMLAMQIGTWIGVYHVQRLIESYLKTVNTTLLTEEYLRVMIDKVSADLILDDFLIIRKFLPPIANTKINLKDILETHVFSVLGKGNGENYDLRVKNFVNAILSYKTRKEGWPIIVTN